MSYILNALRKSEQERQAQEPETITEQVLTPPQKSRKTALLVGGLLAVNLLLAALVVWYLNKTDAVPAKPQLAAQKAPPKTVPIPPPVAAETEAVLSDPELEETDELAEAATPAQGGMQPAVPTAVAQAAKEPSIEELAAAKQAEEQKPAKPVQGDIQARPGQREQRAAAISQRVQLRKNVQAMRARRLLTAENESGADVEVDTTLEKKSDAEPAPASQQEIPLFKDLPYDFRNSAPKLSINVFKYDEKPADRFVVLNMTKYTAGQTTKDSVEIKEIRADSVVASYGGKVFRIERP